MQNSEKGKIAARKGDLVKLAKLVGNIEHIFFTRKIPLQLLTPMKWKGQVSKEIIFNRMFRFWKPDTDQASHALDAVAIGFAAQGRL